MYIRDVRLVLNTFREGRSRVFSSYSNRRVTATHPAVCNGGSGSKCCQTVQEGEEEELIRLCLNTQLGQQWQKPQEHKFLGSQWSTCESSKAQVKNSRSSLEPKLRDLFSSIYKQLSSSRGKQDTSAEGNAGHPPSWTSPHLSRKHTWQMKGSGTKCLCDVREGAKCFAV